VKAGCNTVDVSSTWKETEIDFRMQKDTEIDIKKKVEIMLETEIAHSE
jgi:hypothetical protein